MSSTSSTYSYPTTSYSSSQSSYSCPSAYPPSLVKPESGNRDIARDRFNPSTGARLVAGVIVLSNEITHPLASHDSTCHNKYVLCITSSRHPNKIVLPKGGWEFHESVEEAALRECWEEAGVIGTIDRFLIHQTDSRPPKDYSQPKPPVESGVDSGRTEAVPVKYKGLEFPAGCVPSRAEYQYFQVSPVSVEEDWPERDKRIRKWLTYSEAVAALTGRDEMICALTKSDIRKD